MSQRRQKGSILGYFARHTEDSETDDHEDLIEMLAESYARELSPAVVDQPSRRTCLQIFFRSRVGVIVAVGLAAAGIASIAAAKHARSGLVPPSQPPPPSYVAADGYVPGHTMHAHPQPTPRNETAEKAGAIRVERSETAKRTPKPTPTPAAAVKVDTEPRETTITAGTPPIVEVELSKKPTIKIGVAIRD